jgi:anti-sigma factor RsiW
MNEQNESPKNLSEDPRLTAFALGELPTDEHAAFERELEGDIAAQAEVESIR